MPKKRLVRYIEKYLGKYDEEQIRKRLLKDGWKEKRINSAIETVKKKRETSEKKEDKKKEKKEKKSRGKAKKAKPKLTKKKPEKKKSTEEETEKKEEEVEEKVKAHETRTWKGIKHRSPVAIVIFSIITGGLFFIAWLALTTRELRKNSKTAPSPYWLFILLLPVISAVVSFITLGGMENISQITDNVWMGVMLVGLNLITAIIMLIYYWKYSAAINEISDFSSVGLFLLFVFIAPVAQVISQMKLNAKAEKKPKKDKKEEKGEKKDSKDTGKKKKEKKANKKPKKKKKE